MLAGFDTTATTLTNTCFQLARNPDIQEKLYESIVAQMEDYVRHVKFKTKMKVMCWFFQIFWDEGRSLPRNDSKLSLSRDGYQRSIAFLSTPSSVIVKGWLTFLLLKLLFNCVFRVDRQCTKDYSYDNGRIKIKKGQLVTVPAFALHHMEEYYPDPEKFDPERLVLLQKWMSAEVNNLIISLINFLINFYSFFKVESRE